MPEDRTRPVLLLTRPEAQSRAFAARLGAVPVVIAPILRIVPVAHDPALLTSAEGLLFTSVHAVPWAGAGRGRVAYCVGPATAAAAREAGFAVVEGGGDLEVLKPVLAHAEVPLLHPHGQHVTAGADVPGIVVYDQVAQPLTNEARQLLGGIAPVVLPLFSSRSARLAAAALTGATAPLQPVAISRKVADAWREAGGHPPFVSVAEKPDGNAMRSAIMPLLFGEQS